MSVLALGLNHQSAPLDLRSRLAIPAARLGEALQALQRSLQAVAPAGAPAAPEATLLSTCNRTELYIAGADPRAARLLAEPALEWLAGQGGLTRGQLLAHAYVSEDHQAARHAFRVAAGLDSMVLGEPQILGQMKLAVREAGQAGTLGSTLHQLFQRSFAVAKEVRSATEIGAHSVSMAAAAVRLAQQLFEHLGEQRVLFVGAGEMIELCAMHFAAQRPRAMVLVNRGAERATALADRVAARTGQQLQTLALAELPGRLSQFDIVVSCTASTLPLIGLGAVERALKARRRAPMFMLDLAVPRDIEPEVARLDDVYLYTVDDLARHVSRGGALRQAAVARAEAIVDAGVASFGQWLEQRGSVPLIQSLKGQAEQWQALELQRARRLLARGASPEEALEALAQGLTAKLMHGTLSELHGAGAAEREALAGTLSRLFLRPQRGCPLEHS